MKTRMSFLGTLTAIFLGFSLPPAWATFDDTARYLPEKATAVISVDTDYNSWKYFLEKKFMLDWLKGKEMKEFEAEFQRETGLSFARDVLGALGSHIIAATYESGKQDDPHVMVSANLKNGLAMKAEMDKFKAQVKAKGGKISEEKFKEHTLYTLDTPPDKKDKQAKDDKDMPLKTDFDKLYVAPAGQDLLVSTHKPLLQQALEAGSTGKKSLLQDSRFQAVYPRLKDDKIMIYVDLKTLTKGLATMMAEEGGEKDAIEKSIGKAVEEMVDLYDGFGFSLTPDSQGLKVRSYAAYKQDNLTPEQQKLIQSFTASGEETLKPLIATAPGSPLFFSSFYAQNAKAGVDYLMKWLTTEKDSKAEIDSMIGMVTQAIKDMTNLDFEKDVASHADGRMGLAVFYPEKLSPAAPIPHVVVTVGVKDNQHFLETWTKKFKLDLSENSPAANSQPPDADWTAGNGEQPGTSKPTKMEKLTFGATPQFQHGGANIHVLTENEMSKEMSKEMGISPAFTYLGKVWLFGSHPDALKASIDFSQNRQESLAQNEDFQRVAGRMHGFESNGLFYVDLAKVVQVVNTFAGEDESLQSLQPILKALRAMAGSSKATTQGIEGIFVLDVEVDKIDFAALAKSMAAAEAKAKVSSVKANMHTLQTMVETYGVDWSGTYPPNVATLKKEAVKVQYWKALENPFSEQEDDLVDFAKYKPGPAFKGKVIYKPHQKDDAGKFVSYQIYGCDGEGKLILDKGKPFVLSNE